MRRCCRACCTPGLVSIAQWRTADSIATADAGAMTEAIEAGSDDNQVVIAERDGIPVGCLHILLMKDFFGCEPRSTFRCSRRRSKRKARGWPGR
jgi:hypothetical protein